ncbi:type I toxin-antitoxin system Fst family toxin [Salinicoccus halitifaciens]
MFTALFKLAISPIITGVIVALFAYWLNKCNEN